MNNRGTTPTRSFGNQTSTSIGNGEAGNSSKLAYVVGTGVEEEKPRCRCRRRAAVPQMSAPFRQHTLEIGIDSKMNKTNLSTFHLLFPQRSPTAVPGAASLLWIFSALRTIGLLIR